MIISEQSTRNEDKLSGIIQVLAAIGKWYDKEWNTFSFGARSVKKMVYKFLKN